MGYFKVPTEDSAHDSGSFTVYDPFCPCYQHKGEWRDLTNDYSITVTDAWAVTGPLADYTQAPSNVLMGDQGTSSVTATCEAADNDAGQEGSITMPAIDTTTSTTTTVTTTTTTTTTTT